MTTTRRLIGVPLWGDFTLSDFRDAALNSALQELLNNTCYLKEHVEALGSGGLFAKDSVRAATTADCALSGLLTIDTVTLIDGDRVLVKNQSLAQNNGLYNAHAGAWTRTTDADTDPEVLSGLFVFVREGGQANTSWVLRTPNPIQVGVTLLNFAQFGNLSQYIAGDGLTLAGNIFAVGQKSNGAIKVNADDVEVDYDVSQFEVVGINPGKLTLRVGGIDRSRLSANVVGTGLERTAQGVIRVGVPGFGLTGGGGQSLAVKPDNLTGLTVVPAHVDGNGTGTEIDNATLTHSGGVLKAKDNGLQNRHLQGGIDLSKLAVRVIRADGAQPFTAHQDLADHRLMGVMLPSDGSDAATKDYVDAIASGFKNKTAVRAASTGNVVMSGVQTVDGILLNVDDRVLLKDQTIAKDNGIYDVKVGAWVRSADADESAKMPTGTTVFVTEGTNNGGTAWSLITPAPIILGITALAFTQTGHSGNLSAGMGLYQSGNTFNVGQHPAGAIRVNSNDIELLYDSALFEVTGATPGQLGIKLGSIPADRLADIYLRADGSVPMAGTLDLGSHRIVNVLSPINPNDAVTKAYADLLVQGVTDAKASVRAATTSPIVLFGTMTLDTVILNIDDRVLVKDQGTGVDPANGIYLVKTGAWIRSPDADLDSKVTAGMTCFVEEGSVNKHTGWMLTTPNPISLNVTPLTFVLFASASDLIAGNGLAKTGNQIDVVAADGSITVLPHSIKVGVIDDTQHGTRGGGTTHAVVTTSVDGYMSFGDKIRLDGMATGATNTPLSDATPTDLGTAGSGVGTSASRDDHRHGHGNLAGGSLHAVAIAGGANGFFAGSDKTRLDGMADGATNTPLSSSNPSSVGTANNPGSASSASKYDHTHDHGNQTTATHHAAVTTSTNGFMSAADKIRLNNLKNFGQVYNADVSWLSVTQVTIGTAGVDTKAMSSDATLLMEFNGTLTAAITSSGAGGLDTGAEAANTWYAIHLIGDSTGVNTPKAMLSVSATAPTLPSGYDKFRRIGWVRNNAASDFRKFICDGNSNIRRYINDVSRAEVQALSGGNATAFTGVSLSAFMPSTSKIVDLLCSFEALGGAETDVFGIRPTGSSVTLATALHTVGYNIDATVGTSLPSPFLSKMDNVPTNASQSIDYAVTAAADSANIWVVGYIDRI